MAESTDDLRHKVALSCRILAMTGLMKDVLGHVSVRIPDAPEEMLIRCRGREESGLLFTEDDDIRRSDFSGTSSDLAGQYMLPGELPIHGESLRLRPEVGCVIHAHPPAALLCGLAGIEFRPMLGAYDGGFSLRLALDGIPEYPRSVLISRPDLAVELISFMGSRSVCLMRGHGVTVVGATVEDATVRAIQFEALCRITWQLAVAGKTPHQVPPPDVAEFGVTLARGQRISRLGERAADSIWRYWVKMLDYRGALVPDISVAVPDIAPV